MERVMIHELLAEIKNLQEQVANMKKWMHIQIQSYQDTIARLGCEIRTLLVQTNVLVARIKHQDKLLLQNGINKHF